MADNTDLTPLSLKKENVTPVNSKIAELSESRAELLNRIQNLKNDLQCWRSKLDTQVKSYRDARGLAVIAHFFFRTPNARFTSFLAAFCFCLYKIRLWSSSDGSGIVLANVSNSGYIPSTK
ncbi:hypothetical protein Tco_0153600 [Tanacetum coccineum]